MSCTYQKTCASADAFRGAPQPHLPTQPTLLPAELASVHYQATFDAFRGTPWYSLLAGWAGWRVDRRALLFCIMPLEQVSGLESVSEGWWAGCRLTLLHFGVTPPPSLSSTHNYWLLALARGRGMQPRGESNDMGIP
jgi:hypothetical protein